MTTTGLLIVAVMVFGGLAVVLLPFWDGGTADDETEAARRRAHQIERLQALYAQCVASIRDLDADYAAGRLAADDYQTARDQWSRRGVQALQVLHALEDGAGVTTVGAAARDAAVEQALAGAGQS
ncbi:MAG: hypothetical protein ACOCXZ_02905 [Chloroflexota bacterium]